jgi:hypothetical protein
MIDWVDTVRARLTEVSGGPPDPDVVEELAAHLAQVYETARRRGETDHEARSVALRLLEGSSPILEALQAHRPPVGRRISDWVRQEPPSRAPVSRNGGWMSRLDLVRDARYALRMLVRTPAFCLIAILTFAVGVNTAVFSVVNGVLLRSLPYPDADRITMVWLDNRRQAIKEDITSQTVVLRSAATQPRCFRRYAARCRGSIHNCRYSKPVRSPARCRAC